MQDYRKLQVWQKAHRLTLDVYAIAPKALSHPISWPIRDQALRAALSIPSNIAEGAERRTRRDFGRFLWHSVGSCNELEYDLLLARDLDYLSPADHGNFGRQVEEVRRMLIGLIQSVGAALEP